MTPLMELKTVSMVLQEIEKEEKFGEARG